MSRLRAFGLSRPLVQSLLVPGLLACALSPPEAALGEVREFGPAFARFLVDVPEGWTGPSVLAQPQSWTGAMGEYPAVTEDQCL